MKHVLILGALWGLGLTVAQAATPSPQFLGTWELELAKAPPPAGGPQTPAPKSITQIIKDAGDGRWSSEVVLEMPDGSQRSQPAVVFTLDGKPSPLTGDLTLVVLFPDPRTAAATTVDHGLPVSTETYTLSANGRQMVHVLDTTGPDGNPIHLTQTFNKKKGS